MLLRVKNLVKTFPGPDGALPILQGIDMELAAGETLALTGESGSGKSTLLHLVGGLDQPDSGTVEVDGVEIGALDGCGAPRQGWCYFPAVQSDPIANCCVQHLFSGAFGW